MKGRPAQTLAFAAIALAALCGLGVLRWGRAQRAKHERECVALTRALDKTVRQKSPLIFESIVEHHWDDAGSRCLAALEYHYKPCDAKLLKKASAICGGPDADIAIYAFLDGGARPLLICDRKYSTNEAQCTQSVYGADGTLLTSQDFPPDQFSAIKAGLLGRRP